MRSTPWARRRSTRNPLGAVLTLVAIALITVVVALLLPPEAALSGRASAVDGDTLRIGDTRIRLLGFDAVELDQTCSDAGGTDWSCGREARAVLDELTGNGDTVCTADGSDRYRRVLARCTAGGADLGDSMVRAGWAVADFEYGLALAEARLNGRGIWAGIFDDPAEWRRRRGERGDDFWSWLMGWVGR